MRLEGNLPLTGTERRSYWTTDATAKNFRLVDETSKIGKDMEQLLMATSLFVTDGAKDPAALPSPSSVQLGKSGPFKFVTAGR